MSSPMRGVAVVAHGGGPTPVINSSLAGVVEEARRHKTITALYGARYGILGVLNEDFFDLSAQAPELIEAIGSAPASAIGSCRYKVKPEDYQRILDVFRAHEVRYFFYNGGNDSMDTALRVSRLARERGYELRVIGIPKTIDNDLKETDHCPGYGSAARYIASALRDIGEDNRALPTPITVVEVMGRNAGWLTAATTLARQEPDDAPHLVYLPERRISAERIVADVDMVYRRLKRVVVAVCEGLRDEKGEPFGADLVKADGFGHTLAGNLAHTLSRLIAGKLKLRARSEKPGLLGRSSGEFASATDRAEARLCGAAAVRVSFEGETDKMITLVREPGPGYACATGLAALESVANDERPFPSGWLTESNTDVAQAFREYAAPLTGNIPPHPRLAPLFVRKQTAS